MSDAIVRVNSVPREVPIVRPKDFRLRVVVEPLASVFSGRGYYGEDGTLMPVRYRFLHPDAAESLTRLERDEPEMFYFTDVFRNASGSTRRRTKNRAARARNGKSAIYTGKVPGSSAHNYGLSFDLDVKRTLRNMQKRMADPEFYKSDLDEFLKGYGWWCHRDGPMGGDHGLGSESWHYNYFGDDPERWLAHSHRTTSGGIEAKIQYLYGPFSIDGPQVVELLHVAGYGDRVTDERVQIRLFQHDWTLPSDGIAGPQTQRALLYVTATFVDEDDRVVSVPGP